MKITLTRVDLFSRELDAFERRKSFVLDSGSMPVESVVCEDHLAFSLKVNLKIKLFCLNNNNVGFSGRELSYILLSGILLCFLNTFFLIAKPGLFICTLQR